MSTATVTNTLQLKILTPNRLVVDEAVTSVQAASPDGEFGILPRHVPMIRPLKIGLLRYVQAGKTQTLAVIGGMLTTEGQTVTVLSDAVERGDEIDVARAQQAKERAEARLREKEATVDVKRAELSLARALLRLKVARG